MKKKDSEFSNFDKVMTGLLKVPHAEIKAKLEREKLAKKRKKSRTSSAFREAT